MSVDQLPDHAPWCTEAGRPGLVHRRCWTQRDGSDRRCIGAVAHQVPLSLEEHPAGGPDHLTMQAGESHPDEPPHIALALPWAGTRLTLDEAVQLGVHLIDLVAKTRATLP